MDKNEKPKDANQRVRAFKIGLKDTDIKKEKTVLEKMTSFLGSMYYNISKTIILVVTGVTVFVLVTNYNVFPVMEKVFVREENISKVKDALIPMKGIDFNKDIVTEEEFKAIYDKVNAQMTPVILEKSIFEEGKSAFDEKMKPFYTDSFMEKIVTDDVMYNALASIYSHDNRLPYSVSITSIGKVMKNDKPVTKVVLDINAVDDDLGFHVSSLALFYNNKQEIQDMKVIFEGKDYQNTRTPLDLEYSRVNNSSNTIMIRELNKFFKEFNNKALYDKVQMSAMDINNSQLKSFFSNLDIENKDYEVLSDLFKTIKGTSSNLSVMEYMQTDFDAVASTSIILGVKTTEKIHKYNLQFDRYSEELISISKVQ